MLVRNMWHLKTLVFFFLHIFKYFRKFQSWNKTIFTLFMVEVIITGTEASVSRTLCTMTQFIAIARPRGSGKESWGITLKRNLFAKFFVPGIVTQLPEHSGSLQYLEGNVPVKGTEFHRKEIYNWVDVCALKSSETILLI